MATMKGKHSPRMSPTVQLLLLCLCWTATAWVAIPITTTTRSATSQWVKQEQQQQHMEEAQYPSQNAEPLEAPSTNKNRHTAASPRRRNLVLMGSSCLPALLLSSSEPAQALSDDESQRMTVFERTAPSVVFLDTFTERRDQFSTNILEVPLGSGSGFVWDKEGHIVTNYHVVRNAQTAQIAILTPEGVAPSNIANNNSNNKPNFQTVMPARATTGFGSGKIARSVFKAQVVGVDPSKDIAVLKAVDAPPELLQPIRVGSSKGLKVGQTALAIGNPFGLDHTLTTGIVSGLGREVRSPIGRPISNVIQTDAAINPGNSGGPLLDSSGQLIGMNTAIFSPSGASSGIGFAIPSDTISFIVETLIRDGQIVRPVMGISYLESKQAKALGINNGVLVLDVGPAAAQAGLRGTRRTESGLIEVGDIIVQVGRTRVQRESDLFEALEDRQPGDTVEVTVNRLTAVQDELKVKELTFTIVLQSSADPNVLKAPAPLKQQSMISPLPPPQQQPAPLPVPQAPSVIPQAPAPATFPSDMAL